MSKKISPEVETPIVAKKAGRPAAARDENGAIIRPEGWVKPERKGKAAPVTLTFDGVLKASNGAEFVNGAWSFGNVTAEQVAADLPAAVEAAEKAAQVLAALKAAETALVGLPNPNDKYTVAKLEQDSLFAVVDYLRAR